MSKSLKVKKYKPNTKKTNEKAAHNMSKPSVLFRYIFMIMQALCVAAIGVCFFIFNVSSNLVSYHDGEESKTNVTFYDLSHNYFESDIYTDNLSEYSATILRFVAIREQMEENGEYVANKAVNVGEYANRHSQTPYSGPAVCYYLDDLISWGQRASLESFTYCIYDFYTPQEYCDFFGIDLSELNLPTDFDLNTNYSSFETLKNIYKTVDGLNAEDYAHNEDEYREIIQNVQKAASDLYINFVEYQKYKEAFNEARTNLRYYFSIPQNGKMNIFTNVSSMSKGMSDKWVEERFREYGEYVYACPGKIEFNTNTKVLYDVFKKGLVEDYSYSYPDETKIWIAVDAKFPVEDTFKKNAEAFYRTSRLVPWLVVSGAVALVIFIGLFAIMLGRDRKHYSSSTSKENLSWVDKLPIEISVLFVVIFAIILYLVESKMFNRPSISEIYSNPMIFVTFLGFLTFDFFIILLFTYGFARRIIAKNVFEGSIYSIVRPNLLKSTEGLRKWFWHLYDSAGVSIRTWTGYIAFLLVNCFLTCVLFFTQYKIVGFVCLFLFDVAIGVVLFNRNYERKKIVEGIKRINSGEYEYEIDGSKMHGDNKYLADEVNHIGLGLQKALEVSTKDERLKADLITNVSHDIKTPLTSIINYVDLLKRENIDNDKVKKYISILDEKSQRLKQLTFDLVEASKAASGNIAIDLIRVDFVEFIKQATGEFEEKFHEKKLTLITNLPKSSQYVLVDPRHMWRVLENILNNVCKYALEDTRVYLDVVKTQEEAGDKIVLSLKNISNQQLNIPADELTERFIRGDVSRSTEGSGLGLSIAKNLTIAQKGEFNIYLDGDLFKVTITFDTLDE